MPTRPDADCFGPPGGSGAEFTYDKPNALSLLATAGRTTKSVAPLALTDQFGFGLGVCGIGGVAGDRHELLVPEVQPRGGHRRRGSARDPRRRPGPVLPLAEQLPQPEPGRARAPGAGSGTGRAAVWGHRGRAQVRDPVRSSVRDDVHERPRGRRRRRGGRRARHHRRRRHRAADGRRAGRGAARCHARARTSRPRCSTPASAPSSTTARRRAASGSSAARRATRSAAPRATMRFARAAATTGSTPARAAPT